MSVEIPAGKAATFQLRIGELGKFLVDHRLGVGISIAGDVPGNARGGSLGRSPNSSVERGSRKRRRQDCGMSAHLQQFRSSV
jgi:hypothetical protein